MGRVCGFLLVGLTAVVVACDRTEPPVAVVAARDTSTHGTPGLRIVSGNYSRDTVDAERNNLALVVELFDAEGKPATGSTIRFSTVTPAAIPEIRPVYVGDLETHAYGTVVSASVDARGRASALIKMGSVAGIGAVAIAALESSLYDTARVNVQPGRAAGLTLGPLDTAVYIDGTMRPRAVVIDRYGNARPDVVTLTTNGSALVGSDSGLVSGAVYGRASYVASFGPWAETGWASVVPRATIAAHRSSSDPDLNGIVRVGLDGSGFRRLAGISPAGFASAPTWLGRNQLIYSSSVNGTMQLFTVDLNGTSKPFLSGAPPTLTHRVWPRALGIRGIFFSGYDSTGSAGLWATDQAGAAVREVYRDATGRVESPAPTDNPVFAAAFAVAGTVRVIFFPDSVASWSMPGRHPRFSPDGTRIAYTSNSAPSLGLLHVINTNGTGHRVISSPGSLYVDQAFDWSPDGRWVIARGATTLELIEVETGLTIPLPYATQLATPAWRPLP